MWILILLKNHDKKEKATTLEHTVNFEARTRTFVYQTFKHNLGVMVRICSFYHQYNGEFQLIFFNL